MQEAIPPEYMAWDSYLHLHPIFACSKWVPFNPGTHFHLLSMRIVPLQLREMRDVG